jgi:hypothetical protein
MRQVKRQRVGVSALALVFLMHSALASRADQQQCRQQDQRIAAALHRPQVRQQRRHHGPIYDVRAQGRS